MNKIFPPADHVFIDHHLKLVALFAHHVATPNIKKATVRVPRGYDGSGNISVPILRKSEYRHTTPRLGIKILVEVYTAFGTVFKANTVIQYRTIRDMLEEILRVRWRPSHRKRAMREQIDAMYQASEIVPIAIKYLAWMAHHT